MLLVHAGSNNSPTAHPTPPKPTAWGKHCNMIPLLKNLAEFVLTQWQKGVLDYISAPTHPQFFGRKLKLKNAVIWMITPQSLQECWMKP